MEESHFPSMSNEQSGRFVGISEHVGHALTFLILTDDTQKIIHRSVVHLAANPDAKNLRTDTPPDTDPPKHIQSHIDNDVQDDEVQRPQMPIIDPEELVGKVLSVTKEDGETTRIKVIEAISDHHDANSVYKPTVKFKCSVNNDAYEEVLSYNQILEYLAKEDNDIV